MKTLAGEPLSLALGKLLAIQRRELLEEFSPEVIVPIPMYWGHRLRRRTNSPDFIAQSLAKFLEIPVKRYCLKRCKKTRTQSNLERRERFRNVHGAFQVRFARQIRGRRVLLVDDVLTTGATCSEAAKILKQAGAAMVAVAVIARAHGGKRKPNK
jgi:ComF family protein